MITLAVSSAVDKLATLTSVGLQAVAQTVNLNVLPDESRAASLALAVIVAVPVQPVAGVSVSVDPEILGVTFASDEVAE